MAGETVVLRIEVEREEDGQFFASFTREFSAEHPNGREGGGAEYAATPIGAVANLLAVLIKVDEDNAREQVEAQLQQVTQERDEARAIVAAVNNEVIGSDGYFTTPSCVTAVQEIKLTANRQLRRAEAAEAQLLALQQAQPQSIAHFASGLQLDDED